MKVPHHDTGVGIIEKILHWAMAAGDEDSVVLIQTRCNDIGDAAWIFEPSQAVAKSHVVIKLSLVPTEKVRHSRMKIQLWRITFGVGKGDFVALAHQCANRNRQLVEVVAGALVNLAIFQG